MKQSDPKTYSSFREQSQSHYTVPEAYFLDFAQRMKERIAVEELAPEEHTPALGKRRSLFRSLRPVLYVAASLLLSLGVYQAYHSYTDVEAIPLSSSHSFVSVSDEGSDYRDYMSFIKESSSDVLSNEWVLTDYYE